MASPQIVTSRTATQERWLKLYRKIHNLFMKDELIHVDDYKKMIEDLNRRISELEQTVQKELTSIQAGLSSHIHIAPQAPGGALPTQPPSAPPYTSAFKPTKPIVPVNAAMQKYDALLQKTGPATAPIPAAASADDARTAAQLRADIGT
jgi:hypothetical protein